MVNDRRRPNVLARIAWGAVAAVLGIGMTAGPALSAKEDMREIGSMPVRYPPDVFHGASNGSLILNSILRRGYQFFYEERTGVTTGRIVDLDTQAVLVQRRMPVESFPTGPLAPSTPQLAGEWVHTTDPETQTLYIGTSDTSVGSFAGIAKLDPFTLDVLAFFPDEPVKYRPDTNVDPDNPPDVCAAAACLPQPPTLTPQLRGLAFSDTYLTGLNNGKLLLLMQENSAPPPLESNINVPYVAQWDVETGNQDWLYRVQSCSTSTFPGRDAGLFSLGIFQARAASGIYIACQASGGTGQVVRIPVDGTNSPIVNSEQAYPGPQSVVDAVSDPASDRMILRVQNEDGDSWWVFDGPSSSYAGVIGGTLSRVTAVAAGIDQTTGRLYMLAPPTLKDAQTSEGGLLVSDVRRSPAPQFLSFEDFAGQWEGAIRIDIHPETGDRRIFALRKEAKHYTIIRDGVPISADVSIQDRDRLTIDVEEKKGETGRTFTGAGHAYGLRVLLAGGLEGFPPTGPDLGGFRVGRYVPFMVGTPCGTDTRELVVGSVDQAGLSNNLTSAGASVGNTDPATRTDVGEPTARCYPRPRDAEGNDIWERPLPTGTSLDQRLGKYPNPQRTELDDEETGSANESKTDLDELAGSDWPFTPTQCSENADDATTTRVSPLDRGDTETGPIPADQRTTEVPLDGAIARVDCDLAGSRVSAMAEILTHAQDAPAVEADVPELGQIRVGEVSANTVIYLDPDRGLVSRSVAIVRGISIGDHVSIDAAVGIGEAWAAGRPGTAGTSFQRFLCGVRIKDEAPDTHVFRPNPQIQPPPTEDPTNFDPTTFIDPNLQGGAEIQKRVAKSGCGDPEEPTLSALKNPPIGIDDKQPLIDVINRALGTRGRVSAPKPDGSLAQGTPGGYLASIQKDRLNEISSRAVNSDPSTQVPALELIVFNDDRNQGRGRQLYQFAGVDASVTYGIFLLNPAEFFDPGCAPFCVEDKIDEVLPPTPIGPPATVSTPPPPRQGPLTIMFQGINFLLRSPREALLAAVVWGILFAPVQLASRRRSLRRLA